MKLLGQLTLDSNSVLVAIEHGGKARMALIHNGRSLDPEQLGQYWPDAVTAGRLDAFIAFAKSEADAGRGAR